MSTLVEQKASKFEVRAPTLGRRKTPRHLKIGESIGEHPSSPEEHYRRIYYEALDLVINPLHANLNSGGG